MELIAWLWALSPETPENMAPRILICVASFHECVRHCALDVPPTYFGDEWVVVSV
jgi:hypothetical protein